VVTRIGEILDEKGYTFALESPERCWSNRIVSGGAENATLSFFIEFEEICNQNVTASLLYRNP
jgi:hypothetical protein